MRGRQLFHREPRGGWLAPDPEKTPCPLCDGAGRQRQARRHGANRDLHAQRGEQALDDLTLRQRFVVGHEVGFAGATRPAGQFLQRPYVGVGRIVHVHGVDDLVGRRQGQAPAARPGDESWQDVRIAGAPDQVRAQGGALQMAVAGREDHLFRLGFAGRIGRCEMVGDRQRFVGPADVAAAKRRPGSNNDWVLTRGLLQERGIDLPLEQVIAAFQVRYDQLAAGESLIPDADLLRRLARRLPLGIVTGRPRSEAAAFLDELAELGLGTREIGFTGGEPFMNPHFPAMLEDALERGTVSHVDELIVGGALLAADTGLAARPRSPGQPGPAGRVPPRPRRRGPDQARSRGD